MSLRICHLTSVHGRNDTRIFLKECSSCSKEGFETILIVSDGLGNEVKNNVKIIDIGIYFDLARDSSRLKRMRKTLGKMYDEAMKQDADFYHFHDPELMFVGYWLKRKGKKVIYDAHEDLPKGIYSKPYIKSYLQPIVSFGIRVIENFFARKFYCIITATPTISKRFKGINNNVVNVNNFPILGELSRDFDWSKKEDKVCFLGVITAIRGVHETIEGLQYAPDVKFELAGLIYPETLKDKFSKLPGWSRVDERGVINREQSAELLSTSKLGMVTFLPMRNHLDALPNKLFEYMSAGLPIVASNFPLWKTLIEDNNCGVCVNPNNPQEIGKTIATLIKDDTLLKQMGANGKKAVHEKYNWKNEEVKLFKVYKSIL